MNRFRLAQISTNALAEMAVHFRRHARKVTGPRQAILEVLRHSDRPVTNKEVFAALPSGECDLATVYRAMHLLMNMGVAQRVDFGDGVARFELVDQIRGGHRHHLVCQQCATVVDVEECFPDEMEERIAARNGFKAVTHKLEFFGICPRCQ